MLFLYEMNRYYNYHFFPRYLLVKLSLSSQYDDMSFSIIVKDWVLSNIISSVAILAFNMCGTDDTNEGGEGSIFESIDVTCGYTCVFDKLYACAIDCVFVCFVAVCEVSVKIVCEYDIVTDLYSFDISFNNISLLFLISLSFLFFTPRSIALLLLEVENN